MNYNRKLAENNNSLNALLSNMPDNELDMDKLTGHLRQWYEMHKDFYNSEPTIGQKMSTSYFLKRAFSAI